MDLDVRPLGAALGDESFVWLRLGHRVRRAGRSMKNVLGTGIFRRRLSLTSKGYDIMHRTCGAKTAATILSKNSNIERRLFTAEFGLAVYRPTLSCTSD